MKPIQITFDEDLLRALDATPEVQMEGRSAVLRRAAEEYLLRRRRTEIRERYEVAYGGRGHDIGTELEGWDEEGAWPDD